MKRNPVFIAMILICVAFGCSHSVKYSPQYVRGKTPLTGSVLAGKCLIYTETDDDSCRIASKPRAFLGPQDTIEFPVGEMSKEIAVAAFGTMFRQGCEHSSLIEDPLQYAAIIQPKVTRIEHSYHQPFLAFKTTPRVKMGLHLSLYDGQGEIFLRKQYESGLINGESVFAVVPENVNELAHSALYDLMAKAAGDVRLFVAQKTTSGRQVSSPVNQVTIAVADLTGSMVSARDLASLAGELRVALSDTGSFKVVSKEYMDYVLSTQGFGKGGKGRTEDLARMGKLVEVENMLGGSVVQSGDMIELSLCVVNVADGRLAFESREKLAGGINDLLPIIRSLAETLARRLL